MSKSDLPALSRLIHFTPLRYPGGKAKLAEFLKALLKANDLLDGDYVEPYAGGAAIALELLFQEYVDRIHINDVSKPVYAFWKSVLTRTDELCNLIASKPLTVVQWDKQKSIFNHPDDHDELQLGFAMFYLNRTNRSGILNGGIIGGRDQTGPWKIDARYNARELVRRVKAIGAMRDRIKLTNRDALKFLKAGIKSWPEQTMIYLDPPYYVKGRDLYHDFYEHNDHQKIADLLHGSNIRQRWIVSYDNVPAIREFYEPFRHFVYTIGYSARSASRGSEVIYFCDDLEVPALVGPVVITEDNRTKHLKRA